MASLESSGTAPLMELSTNVPAGMPLITLPEADTAKKMPLAVLKVDDVGPPVGKACCLYIEAFLAYPFRFDVAAIVCR